MNKNNRILKFRAEISAVVVSLILFLAVLLLVRIGLFDWIDKAVNVWFSVIMTDQWYVVMKGFSFIGDVAFVILVSLLILTTFYLKRRAKEGLFYSFSVFVGTGFGYLIKEIIARARPVNLIEFDYSFPSIHVLTSTIICVSLSYIFWKSHRKTAIVLLIVPLIMAFSRLYLNVHWLSDVIAGIFFGLFWVFLGIIIFHRKN